MGGFYIGLCMPRTIYEQFTICGIIEILGEKGTIKGNLKGGDVKGESCFTKNSLKLY